MCSVYLRFVFCLFCVLRLCSPQYVLRRIEMNESFPIPRVVGGTPAVLGEFPYQIGYRTRISRSGDYSTFCGGSLIRENKMLSAAHCFSSFYKGSKCSSIVEVSKRELSKIFAVAGTLLTRDRYRLGGNVEGQWRRLSGVFYMSRYKFPNLDICVVMSAKPFTYNSHVAPIKYATRFADYKGLICVVSGYGRISITGKVQSDRLLKVNLELISNRMCQSRIRVNNKFVCTVYGLGTDVGKGDSGGPLVCQTKESPSKLLTGIVSGHKIRYGSFFTRVSSYTKFIKSNHAWRIDLSSVRHCVIVLAIILVIKNTF